MHSMLVEGNNASAALHMKDLVTAIHSGQPKNADLMIRVAAPIARVACGDHDVVLQTQALVQNAVQLSVNKPTYVLECARQLSLSGNFKCALFHSRCLSFEALIVSGVSSALVHGMLWHQLDSGIIATWSNAA
jgi:hypothetical protein